MFTGALFTTAKTWEQPREMDRDVIHTHNGILLSRQKERNNAICSNMDGPRDDHTEGSKSEKQKYRVTYLICGL